MKNTVRLMKASLLSLPMALSANFALAHDFQLTILHMNDHHSHLEADKRMSMKLDGQSTRVQSGGFPKLATLFADLSEGKDNVLKLHAGDAITGDLYYTLFKGEADAAMMNVICFDAFALGNHEFDGGDAGLKTFLDFLNQGDCETPALAANVEPKIGVSPLTPSAAESYIKPYVIKEVGGEKIGIIGIDIAKKTKQSSSPDETTIFHDEVETAQHFINELTAQNVNKIILLTHYQFANDINMASKLIGVDVIVGGDSHSLLGDFEALGISSEGSYPTQTKSKDGNMVCVVQAWQYAQIVGELNVSFNHDGDVTSCAGLPHMPIADSFKRKNAEGKRVEIEGEEREKAMAAITAHPSVHITEDHAETKAVLESFKARVDELKTQEIGQTPTKLCLERIPGQGKSKACDASETATHGSDITMLVSHAFRDMAKGSEIAIQNGGGVRIDIAEGPITIGDAYKLLPFANSLVVFDITGAEIKAVLEEALDYSLSEGGSTGAYPYAAGLRWHIDASLPKGERFTGIEFKGPEDADWTVLDLNRSYKLVTNNFIAKGRDGYLTFKTVAKDGRMEDTFLDYAQSFVDYVTAKGMVDRLPYDDYSTQSFKR